MQEPVSVLEQIKVENLHGTDIKDENVSKLSERFDESDKRYGADICGSHLTKGW